MTKTPRSVLFQLRQLIKHFDRLPKERSEAAVKGKAVLDNCLSRLEQTDARELVSSPLTWQDSSVAVTIRQIMKGLPQLSDHIATGYFVHSEISRTGRGEET